MPAHSPHPRRTTSLARPSKSGESQRGHASALAAARAVGLVSGEVVVPQNPHVALSADADFGKGAPQRGQISVVRSLTRTRLT
jgi:hypothetical protein